MERSVSFFIDAVILAPFTEEFFFRGFMIGLIFEYANIEKNVLVRSVAIIGSIVISLCGFTLMHLPDNFLHALYYGFLFSVIMIAYRSLYFSRISNFAVIFPMIPHLLNNFFNVNNILLNNNLVNSIIFLIILILMIFWSIILYKNITRVFNIINEYERRFSGARI
ncbi:MAG: CPBP family intramembrane metalloprotease [Candidatus Methanomethyliaceae archaeon]|nr:CPBP family intramembrane metalloprotease [Candidatus Methanomethyliaceae archaeon]MDW7971299.1 CPBP family intramembrane glutamic endopeptidase [Nitrososphaerota archaeon]